MLKLVTAISKFVLIKFNEMSALTGISHTSSTHYIHSLYYSQLFSCSFFFFHHII